jgi:ABC-2 type transport system permease protein
MAGIVDTVHAQAALSSGPFGALARTQYRALAAMRWSMFRNSLRSTQGAIELGARTIATVFYVVMGLGLAAGIGAGAYAIAASNKWEILPALFWVLFVLWQVVPVSLASFQEHFDLGGLLRFPVGFGAFFLLHLIFGLVDASTIMGGLCSLGIWIGITVARPDLYAWTALALAVFGAFNILLVRAIAAWIDRWLAQRRTREIVGALFFLVLLSMQLLNPAYWQQKHPHVSAQSRAAGLRWLNRANAIQRFLPPGLAAFELQRSSSSRSVPAMEAVSLLGIYVLATGGVLAVRLRGEYRGENFSDAPARKKVERRIRARTRPPAERSSSVGWMLIDGSGPIAAVMEKEVRVLMRAMPLLYGLGAPLLMVFILSGLFIRRGAAPSPFMSMSLLVSIAYAMVGFTQLFYNNLGPEGPGLQVLFLCPTPMRTIMLAKNLFHALLFLADAVLVCVVASLRIGWPAPAAIAATASWLLFALPVHLAAGNAFSLAMPYRMNLGRITRQRGSQANALFSMLIQLGVLGLGAGIMAVCLLFGNLWMAVPVLLVLAAAAIFFWIRALDHIDAMAGRRRESLMSTLVRTE